MFPGYQCCAPARRGVGYRIIQAHLLWALEPCSNPASNSLQDVRYYNQDLHCHWLCSHLKVVLIRWQWHTPLHSHHSLIKTVRHGQPVCSQLHLHQHRPF